MISGSITAVATDEEYQTRKYLNIAAADTKPISIERLLYTALKDIGFEAAYTYPNPQAGFGMANRAEVDGVVSAMSELDQTYTSLRKIPVLLDQSNILAFVREDSDLKINRWDDLSALKVGILTQRPYIPNQIPDSAVIITKTPTLSCWKVSFRACLISRFRWIFERVCHYARRH